MVIFKIIYPDKMCWGITYEGIAVPTSAGLIVPRVTYVGRAPTLDEVKNLGQSLGEMGIKNTKELQWIKVTRGEQGHYLEARIHNATLKHYISPG